MNIVNNIGAFPTKNWQESYYDKADDISGETLAEKYLVKPGACHRCPIACGRVVNVNGKVVGGPEYEPLWAYGGNCGNNDLNVIDECNMLCNEYGLDAISVPCTIAAAWSCTREATSRRKSAPVYLWNGVPPGHWWSGPSVWAILKPSLTG